MARGICDILADTIKFAKQEIKQKEARIRVLKDRLRKLQSQPHPDQAQIAQVKNDIQELESQLESIDRPQLNALEEDFSVHCHA